MCVERDMSNKSTGIILKQPLSQKNTVALLDKRFGRIEGIFMSSDVCAGSLMQYDARLHNNRYFINDLQLIYIPLSLAQVDLLFLHHVLEICYYFIPIGSGVAGVFDLLLFLYTVDHMWKNKTLKKIFVFKLLTTLGVWPDYHNVYTSRFDQLSALPIDRINGEAIDLACEQELDDWLRCCMAQHPCIDEFQTVNFLNENRAV